MKKFRIFDEIFSYYAESFSDFIGNIQSGEDVQIEIMSYGGEFYSGVAIAELILGAIRRGVHVTSCIYGIAASAAAIIALATEHVVMTDAGTMMLHGVRYDGDDDDTMDDGLMLANEASLAIIQRRCPSFSLEMLMEKDRWYSAQEAKHMGLIDEIIWLSSSNSDFSVTTSALAMMQRVIKASALGGKKMETEEKKESYNQTNEDKTTEAGQGEEKTGIMSSDVDLKEVIVDGFSAILDKLTKIESMLALEESTVEKPAGDDIMVAKIRAMYDKIGKISVPCVQKTNDKALDPNAELKAAAERIRRTYPNISQFYTE